MSLPLMLLIRVRGDARCDEDFLLCCHAALPHAVAVIDVIISLPLQYITNVSLFRCRDDTGFAITSLLRRPASPSPGAAALFFRHAALIIFSPSVLRSPARHARRRR